MGDGITLAGTANTCGSSANVTVTRVQPPDDDPPGSAPVPARPVDRPPNLPPMLASVA